MIYFAYGSNMLLSRLAARVPSARPVGTAMLEAHRLHFRKKGRDGSAKCDIHFTGSTSDCVHGVLFEIAPEHGPALDEAEGLGGGYGRKEVVVIAGGRRVSAFTYYALQTDASLRPFHWYKALVLAGASEHGLPGDYVDRISSVASCPDPDPRRHRAHELILKIANE